MSCATCHDPADRARAPTIPIVVVPSGGAALDVPGFRNAPSLRYLQSHVRRSSSTREGTPTGGFNRDGRAKLACRPGAAPVPRRRTKWPTRPPTTVIAKLRAATYADEFRRVFGAGDLRRRRTRRSTALASRSRNTRTRTPSSTASTASTTCSSPASATLTDRELHGLALFNNPDKGNCAACHPSGRGADGSPPLFTDFTYDNLGVPRNPAIPANDDPAYFDLGLCGPFRTDLANRTDLCGAFKVPTLRNVAVTRAVLPQRPLRDAARCRRRSTCAATRIPRSGTRSTPTAACASSTTCRRSTTRNVNTTEVPYNRQPGDAPALTPDEIDLVVEFLNTLTDGYQP